LRFRDADRLEILDTLERDIEIMQSNNIMDYSLLFAVESNPNYMRGNTQYKPPSHNSGEEDE